MLDKMENKEVGAARPAGLTALEWDIVRLSAAGLTVADLAARKGVSTAFVESALAKAQEDGGDAADAPVAPAAAKRKKDKRLPR